MNENVRAENEMYKSDFFVSNSWSGQRAVAQNSAATTAGEELGRASEPATNVTDEDAVDAHHWWVPPSLPSSQQKPECRRRVKGMSLTRRIQILPARPPPENYALVASCMN